MPELDYQLSTFSPIDINFYFEYTDTGIKFDDMLKLLYQTAYRSTYLVNTVDYYSNYKDIEKIKQFFIDLHIIKEEDKDKLTLTSDDSLLLLYHYFINIYETNYMEDDYHKLEQIPIYIRNEIGLLLKEEVLTQYDDKFTFKRLVMILNRLVISTNYGYRELKNIDSVGDIRFESIRVR